MRQFIRQQNRLFMKDGILYHKNESQEVNHPDRNTMQLVLPDLLENKHYRVVMMIWIISELNGQYTS